MHGNFHIYHRFAFLSSQSILNFAINVMEINFKNWINQIKRFLGISIQGKRRFGTA